MPVDYDAIRAENIRRYGTEIVRLGSKFLANRYADRSHLVFELLQNAEDALLRRRQEEVPRSVHFDVTPFGMRVAHYGCPFSEEDVRGICGIGEGTKPDDLSTIGRFGIGFKSVYQVTDSPQVHSSDEHFVIENFVWPRSVDPIPTEPGQTVFLLPFKTDDSHVQEDLIEGLKGISARALLFLTQIQGIGWSSSDGRTGSYYRELTEHVSADGRLVLLGTSVSGEPDCRERWLIFSRQVSAPMDTARNVEVAFLLRDDAKGRSSITRVQDSTLVVYFPTALQTGLGFMIQGPYRTTPSRDNVSWADEWNRHLVHETATLLADALEEVRDLGMLDAEALQVLPLDSHTFHRDAPLRPLYDSVLSALKSRPLLPRYGGGHVAGAQARIGRTKESRDLFSADQLAVVLGSGGPLAWLSSDITADRAPQLRSYLVHELGIDEMTWDDILPRLTSDFLRDQSDTWISQLYTALSDQRALLRKYQQVPLIRLQDGTQVAPKLNGVLQAFIPGPDDTDFPTVRREICDSDAVLCFLKLCELEKPNPVDDVIRNLLPRYEQELKLEIPITYESDLLRMARAYGDASQTQRDRMVTTARDTPFVAVVDAGSGEKSWVTPSEAYLATERARVLFAGVRGVLIIDDSIPALADKRVAEFLKSCGASDSLRVTLVHPSYTWREMCDMAEKAGQDGVSYDLESDDYTIDGLDQLLELIGHLPAEEASQRAGQLWSALIDLERERGQVFSATFRFFYYTEREYKHDAGFVRLLNGSSWIPDGAGTVRLPKDVPFGRTGWQADRVVQTIIPFLPDAIETLARETGIEESALMLLKQCNITSEAQLRVALGISDDSLVGDGAPDTGSVEAQPVESHVFEPAPVLVEPSRLPEPAEPTGLVTKDAVWPGRDEALSSAELPDDGYGTFSEDTAPFGGQQRREFVSYVAVGSALVDDSDGLGYEERMTLEEAALALVIRDEPNLHRTLPGNPGFDLYEIDEEGEASRWIEVKAMSGSWESRPVTLTRREFEEAQRRREAYWLYVVEQAGSLDHARILKVQNPAGKAQSYAFDHGWLAIAETTSPPLPNPPDVAQGGPASHPR